MKSITRHENRMYICKGGKLLVQIMRSLKWHCWKQKGWSIASLLMVTVVLNWWVWIVMMWLEVIGCYRRRILKEQQHQEEEATAWATRCGAAAGQVHDKQNPFQWRLWRRDFPASHPHHGLSALCQIALLPTPQLHTTPLCVVCGKLHRLCSFRPKHVSLSTELHQMLIIH